MDVFDVRSRLIDDYKAFTTSTVDIADPRVRQYVSDQLDGDRQWPEPWLSLNPAFASGGRVDDLVAEGLLHGECDICRSTDERTTIASIVGEGASPEGGTLLAMPAEERSAAVLLCIWNSFAFDFCARQKVGGTHLKYFTMRQLPTLPGPLLETPTPWAPEQSLESWLVVRAAALSVSATDMAALADSLDASVAPLWRPKRHLIRAELDACMFHLFGVARDDVDYVLETFPIVKRKDIAAHGEYRTKRLILETYDAMVEAIETGVPYESPFDDLLTEGE